MKRVFLIVLAAAAAFIFTGCVPGQGVFSAVSTESAPPSCASDPSAVTIESAVLLDSDGVRVTAEELDMNGSRLGPTIRLLIENDTERSLTFQCGCVAVNGYVTESIFFATVGAGKQASDSITLLNTSLADCGVETPAEISLWLRAIDSDSLDVYINAPLSTLFTSAFGKTEQVYDESGGVIFDSEGFKLVEKGLDGDYSFVEPSILVYSHNTTGRQLHVLATGLLVNGHEVSCICSFDLPDGMRSVGRVLMSGADLIEAGISSASELTSAEISFRVTDRETGETVAVIEAAPLEFGD